MEATKLPAASRYIGFIRSFFSVNRHPLGEIVFESSRKYIENVEVNSSDRNYNAKGGRAYKLLDDAITFIGKEFGLK